MNEIRRLIFIALLPCLPAFAAEPAAPVAHKPLALADLSTDEVRTYQYGEISTASLIGGGLLGTFVGLGTGHIVYGEYSRKGWIFTAGELGSVALLAYGATRTAGCFFLSGSSCSNAVGIMTAGVIGYYGFRIWEIIDVWTLPGAHNREYRAIKARLEGDPIPEGSVSVMPLFYSEQRSGTQLGLTLGFNF